MKPSLIGGGANVKLWAAITPDGFLAYAFYEGKMTGPRYIDILEHTLFPRALERFGSHDNWEFQQDNASWHTVDGVYDLLEELGIDDFHHPPNSPDLNPVENVWARMKPRVFAYNARTKQNFKRAVRDVIHEMNAEEPQTHFFKHLYKSMPGRMHEVLANHGLPTAH